MLKGSTNRPAWTQASLYSFESTGMKMKRLQKIEDRMREKRDRRKVDAIVRTWKD